MEKWVNDDNSAKGKKQKKGEKKQDNDDDAENQNKDIDHDDDENGNNTGGLSMQDFAKEIDEYYNMMERIGNLREDVEGHTWDVGYRETVASSHVAVKRRSSSVSAAGTSQNSTEDGTEDDHAGQTRKVKFDAWGEDLF